MVDNFQKYLETINRRYQEALKVFKPSHRQPVRHDAGAPAKPAWL